MWNKLVAFWKAHPVTVHSVSIAIVTATTLYEAVPAVKTLVNNVYSAMPSWSHQVVAAVLGIVAFYYKSGNKQ